MEYDNKIIQEEQQYAAAAKAAVGRCTEKELSRLKEKRTDILEERKYFIDYFYELKEDEKRDLLENEYLDTKTYEKTLSDLARLGRQMQEPYFARFDFCETEDETAEKYYIGIHTVTDPLDGRIVIYDWRAPVASLYYEYEPGSAAYKAPGGEVTGDLLLKRRYVFKKGELKSFSDINMPSDDELLNEVLSQKSETHMKTILQTIQTEQHRIIRDYIEGVSVIQGCPGSGKSSVALHKAAYVLYCFRERLKNQKIAVISPNSVFAEYISTVLPDLGEENVDTLLAEDIVASCLSDEADVKYADRAQTNELFMKGLRSDAVFKSSEDFRMRILNYAKELEQGIFMPSDLILDDGTVCMTSDEIGKLFYEEMKGTPLLKRADSVAKYICDRKKYHSYEMRDYIYGVVNSMMKSSYISELYRMMFRQEEEPASFIWEDACAMALLKILLKGIEAEYSIFYLIADEAQDFTPVFLEILNRKFRGCNMLFVGDRDQLVFENSGNYREDIKRIISKKPYREYNLNTNYRSTAQIMDFALKIMGRTETDGVLCVRQGDTPEVRSVAVEDLGAAVSEYIQEMYQKGYENIAVLCKSQEDSMQIRGRIDLPIKVANGINLKVLPVYMAKGLEFDAVAVWNADRGSYCRENDRNLLYTAVTRAMHNVRVFCAGEPSVFLQFVNTKLV